MTGGREEEQFRHCFPLCRQITKLSERVRSDSEVTGSQVSLASAGKEGRRKLERQVTVVEEEKLIEKQTKEKDKLIQAESVQTGRVSVFFFPPFFFFFVLHSYSLRFWCCFGLMGVLHWRNTLLAEAFANGAVWSEPMDFPGKIILIFPWKGMWTEKKTGLSLSEA